MRVRHRPVSCRRQLSSAGHWWVCIDGSESFADDRNRLLSWAECEKRMYRVCFGAEHIEAVAREINIPCEYLQPFVGPLKPVLQKIRSGEIVSHHVSSFGIRPTSTSLIAHFEKVWSTDRDMPTSRRRRRR
jgi:hypothetical protein